MEPVKLFLAGGKGSGKTTYLASLYGKYALTDINTGIYCKVDLNAEEKIKADYKNLRSGEWPRQTAIKEIKPIKFNFMVRSEKEYGNKEYQAMSLLVHDYPGGIFTGEDMKESENASELAIQSRTEILSLANNSDAWVVFIDGDKLKQSISENQLNEKLSFDLSSQIASLSTSGVTAKTTYFVITKWDQFTDTNDSIIEARDILAKDIFFSKYLFNQKISKNSTRIVPVSAVGHGFANRNALGHMPITQNKEPQPLNLEIPLAITIIDRIKAEFKKRSAEIEAEANKTATQSAGEIDWWRKLLNGAASIAQNSTFIDSIRRELGLNRATVEAAISAMKEPYNKNKAEIETRKERNLAAAAAMRKNLHTNEEAINYGVKILMNAYIEYETKYPSAKLTG